MTFNKCDFCAYKRPNTACPFADKYIVEKEMERTKLCGIAIDRMEDCIVKIFRDVALSVHRLQGESKDETNKK